MRGLSREQFVHAIRTTAPKNKGKDYWQRSFAHRWPYIEGAIGIFNKVKPTTVLELGCAGLPIIQGSDTMDYSAEFNPKILHDGSVFPWPVADGAYDMFIGLQVFEHLKGMQQFAFDEVRRIARHAVLSLPYEWKTGSIDHRGINMAVINWWTRQTKPESKRIYDAKGCKRILLHWRF